MSSSGYFIISVPGKLDVDVNSVITMSLDGTNVALQRNISAYDGNGQTIGLSSFNSSSSNIQPQDIVITISNVLQPNSVVNIPAFRIQIYYSSDNNLMAYAISNNLASTPGFLDNPNVKYNSTLVMDTNVLY
jgi:hypothetical protein